MLEGESHSHMMHNKCDKSKCLPGMLFAYLDAFASLTYMHSSVTPYMIYKVLGGVKVTYIVIMIPIYITRHFHYNDLILKYMSRM